MTNKDFLAAIMNDEKKEHDVMSYTDAKVIVGGKVYPAMSVNYEQQPGLYPTVEVTATLVPHGAIGRYASPKIPTITNVIFNPPATIVFWSDKTKTVVKCDYEHEDYDPEKGIAMAISKKMIGDNKYEYYNTFLHWLKKWDKQQEMVKTDIDNASDTVHRMLTRDDIYELLP